MRSTSVLPLKPAMAIQASGNSTVIADQTDEQRVGRSGRGTRWVIGVVPVA